MEQDDDTASVTITVDGDRACWFTNMDDDELSRLLADILAQLTEGQPKPARLN